MKYQASLKFKADYENLSDDEKATFRSAVQELNRAYSRRGDRPIPEWPGSLCVKALSNAEGVFELTWPYRRPDGRATFQFIDIDGEPGIHWRRIGDHRIFQDP